MHLCLHIFSLNMVETDINSSNVNGFACLCPTVHVPSLVFIPVVDSYFCKFELAHDENGTYQG